MTSRPPSLTTIVRRALVGECALPKGSTVVVAVSGGPDSMALLSAMARVAPSLGIEVRAHGVDHGLRPEAAAELDLAAAFAERLGICWSQSRVAVSRGGNLQARARDKRWASLVDAARGTSKACAIATAHHSDDRAETFLIRLLRGSGPRGLGVLPSRTTAPNAEDVPVVRPLLRAARIDVMAHLERHGVPFSTDPSNDDTRYLRTRVRQTVLPLLKELDPSVVRHLEGLADELVQSVDNPRHRRPPEASPEEPAWTLTLPRPTREALRALRTHPSGARTRREVWLPGGFVATFNSDRGGAAPRVEVGDPSEASLQSKERLRMPRPPAGETPVSTRTRKNQGPT